MGSELVVFHFCSGVWKPLGLEWKKEAETEILLRDEAEHGDDDDAHIIISICEFKISSQIGLAQDWNWSRWLGRD